MYQNNKLTKAVRLAIAAGVTTTALAMPTMAFAADEAAEESVERIQVTGSRIKRQELTAVTPIISVDAQEFAISGNLNVEQKLAELPSTLPAFGPSSNNPGDGSATVDLRGLGTSRTLVMVNGRRWIPSRQDGVVDLNTIPASLIENVEIITGGASAVYGSDALGGVVNFNMKDDFEGVEISALYDTTSEGDGQKYNLDLTMGGNFADDRGNAVVYIGYSKREPIFQGDRDFSDVALTEGTDANGNPALVPGGSSGIPGTRVFGGPTLVGGAHDGSTLGRFNQDGTGNIWQDPQDRFNYAPDNFLQLPQERYTMNAFSHFYINDETRIYAEMSFIHNEVPQELAPTPAFVGSLEVNPNSAFFGQDVQDAMNALVPELDDDGEETGNMITALNADGNYVLPFIGRRMVENGSRQSLDTRDAMRILVGVDGYINDEWSYDVYYSRSQLDHTNLLNNDVSESRFRQAILVNDAGTACADASGGCAPLNIFGEGNISQDAIDFINVGAANVTSITQEVFMANVSGTLPVTVPSADEPIGLVFGYEKRDDESSFRPDEFLSAGDVLGFNAGKATVGAYGSDELFAEVSIPLVANAPFAKDLSLWGAARYADYSNIGNVTSFAGAVNWSINDMISTRIGYQQAVRAPNVSELFLGQSNGFPSATDPCSADGFQAGVTDVALCEATGVASGQVGVFSQANTQIEGLFGGNPDLTEETSDTFTVGIVVAPMEGLDFTLDYFNISIEDSISVLGGGVDNVLDICYNQVKDINSAFCQAVTRRGDSNVDVVNVLNENIAKLETSGIDFNITYNKEFDFGFAGNGSDLNIQFRSTFLDTFDVTPVVGLDTVNECAGYFGNTCGTPLAEFQANTRVNWTSGDLTLSALIRYISEVEDDSLLDPTVTADDLVVPTLDAEWYLDISANYHVNDALSVNFGINNILDTEPTPVGDQQSQANTFPEVYTVLGPRLFISATYKFN
jgi:outer membrane receptor protein involved in Fe transport